MKKSILATLFAGLFTLGAIAGDDNRNINIEVNKQHNSSTVVNVDNGEGAQVFEFTEQEMQDKQLIEDRLANLDDETRKAVLNALNGIHFGHGNVMFIDKDIEVDGDNQMVFIRKSGDHEMIINRDEIVDVDREVIIDVIRDHDVEKLQKVIKHRIGDRIAVKIGHADGMKLHHDAGHAARMIQKMLEHSDLTQEQLDKIQQSLDAKR